MLGVFQRYLQGQRWGVWAGVAVVAAMYLVYAELLPRAHGVHARWTTWQGHRERLERGVGWREELARVQAEQERLQARYAARMTSLAPEGRTSATFDILRQAALDHDVILHAVRPGAREEKKTHAEQDITLQLIGHFPALIGFVHAVEAAPQLIKVRRLRIAVAEPPRDAVEAEVEIRVFSADERVREGTHAADSAAGL